MGPGPRRLSPKLAASARGFMLLVFLGPPVSSPSLAANRPASLLYSQGSCRCHRSQRRRYPAISPLQHSYTSPLGGSRVHCCCRGHSAMQIRLLRCPLNSCRLPSSPPIPFFPFSARGRCIASGAWTHHAVLGDDGLGTARISRGGSDVGLATARVARLASCAVAAHALQ